MVVQVRANTLMTIDVRCGKMDHKMRQGALCDAGYCAVEDVKNLFLHAFDDFKII